jgi:hypothetical protein
VAVYNKHAAKSSEKLKNSFFITVKACDLYTISAVCIFLLAQFFLTQVLYSLYSKNPLASFIP